MRTLVAGMDAQTFINSVKSIMEVPAQYWRDFANKAREAGLMSDCTNPWEGLAYSLMTLPYGYRSAVVWIEKGALKAALITYSPYTPRLRFLKEYIEDV